MKTTNNLSDKENVLLGVSKVLMYFSAFSLRVIYRLLFGWGRYRGFELDKIVIECAFTGIRKPYGTAPTRETDRRVKQESKALKEFLVSPSEATRSLSLNERVELMKQRTRPTDIAAVAECEVLRVLGEKSENP